MSDHLLLAALTVGVMVLIGVGLHFGEHWIDSYFDDPPSPKRGE